MLARIANNLYWTGRYLERSEHLARYLRVQYFSMLDAPMEQSREFTLASILNMYGVDDPAVTPASEADVLRAVAMDYGQAASIRSTIKAARENASALRHVISGELWETMNAYHLYADGMNPDYFVTHGLHEFTEEVGRYCAGVRARIDDTLLHDEVWIIIKLGIHLERVIQVIRILSSKVRDIDLMTDRGENQVLLRYQGTVVLKILEGFDMHRKLFRQHLTRETAIKFIICHPHFSRSLAYNMGAVLGLLERMESDVDNTRDDLLFQAGKLYSRFRYLMYKEIEADVGDFLDEELQNVYNLHDTIVQTYFKEV